MSFSFGSSAAPASTGFGGFGGLGGTATTSSAPSGFGTTTATAPSFGGFGGGTTAPSFGGFGAPATSAPAFGGFGTPAGSTTGTTPAAGGFGAPATGTSSFGGFGSQTAKVAPQSFGCFGIPPPGSNVGTLGNPLPVGGAGFGNTLGVPSGFNALAPAATTGGGGWGAPSTATVSAPATSMVAVGGAGPGGESVLEFSAETPYNELPAGYKAELDRTWKEMKQPMRAKLGEVARSRGNVFEEVRGELQRIHLAVLKVENEQRRLQGEIFPFLTELKTTSETGRMQAVFGLQQIRIQSGAVTALDEDLPCRWYGIIAEQLSSRLNACVETVHNYERQLSTRLHALEQHNSITRGAYGQLRRVGAQDLVTLMQEQAK